MRGTCPGSWWWCVWGRWWNELWQFTTEAEPGIKYYWAWWGGQMPFKCKTITDAWNSLVSTLTCESQSGEERAECRPGTLSSHQAETERPAAAAAASWCCMVQQFHPTPPIALNYILVPDIILKSTLVWFCLNIIMWEIRSQLVSAFPNMTEPIGILWAERVGV